MIPSNTDIDTFYCNKKMVYFLKQITKTPIPFTVTQKDYNIQQFSCFRFQGLFFSFNVM